MPEREPGKSSKSARLHGALRKECAVGVNWRTEVERNGMSANQSLCVFKTLQCEVGGRGDIWELGPGGGDMPPS